MVISFWRKDMQKDITHYRIHTLLQQGFITLTEPLHEFEHPTKRYDDPVIEAITSDKTPPDLARRAWFAMFFDIIETRARGLELANLIAKHGPHPFAEATDGIPVPTIIGTSEVPETQHHKTVFDEVPKEHERFLVWDWQVRGKALASVA
jgi:hypothetical protein